MRKITLLPVFLLFTVFSLSAQPTGCEELTTSFTGGTSCGAGNMFDLEALNYVEIEGFTIHPNATNSNFPVDVYYVVGGYQGTTQSDWTLVESVTVSTTSGQPEYFALTNPMVMNPGDELGIYLLFDAIYTNAANTYSNSDLIFTSGNGNCSNFDYCCDPRTWNGTIHYCTENPDCYSPPNVTLDDVAHNGAELSWEASPDETDGYNWVLMNEGDDPDTGTPVQSGNESSLDVTITGLAPETSYDFFVQTDCDAGGLSVWRRVNFETLVACPRPTELEIDGVTENSAGVSWKPSSNESDGYRWIVMLFGEDPDMDTPVASGLTDPGTATAVITGLFPETVYGFYVWADCGIEGESLRSGPAYFLTDQFVCPMPASPALELDGTSVALMWSEPASAPEDGYYWALHYKEEDPSLDPPIAEDYLAPGVTSAEIGGLDPETVYDLRIYSVCDAGSNPQLMSRSWLLRFTTEETVGIYGDAFPGFGFYPNPTGGLLTMVNGRSMERVEVYNLVGQRVLEQQLHTDTATLDFSDLAAGDYLLMVTAGGETGVYRVIKK